VKQLDSLGQRERAVVDQRRRSGYRVERLRLAEFEPVLRALVERLLPGVPESIDVAAFVDGNAEHKLGRGDRRAGGSAVAELLRQGLATLDRLGFADRSEEAQNSLIGRLRRGEADEELGFEAKEFIDRLLVLACAGYLAHPDTWERIGFAGPAYPEGYAWISRGATRRRHEGFTGAGRL
jgi:hypothetical protein